MNKKSKKSILLLWAVVIALFAVNLFILRPFGGSDDIVSPSNAAAQTISAADAVSRTDPVVSSGSVSITDAAEEEPDTVTIQMAGDVLLHGTVTRASSNGDGTYDLEPYVSLIGDAYVGDIRIANLETPVDVYGNNNNIEGYPCFNVPYEILPTMKSINVNLLSTATNHSIDKGYDGLVKTLENIERAGMTAVGTYATEDAAKEPYLIMEVNGIKVGIICYTSVANIPVKDSIAFSVNQCQNKSASITSEIIPLVDELKADGAELIVTIIHWGSEYVDQPADDLRKAAAELCEAGVDIIFGGHSHCVQPIELMTVDRGGKESKALIVYSLGNFFSNQTALEIPKTQYGMIVSVKAQRDEDGIVRVSDAFYLPTYCYIRGDKGDDFMRICYPGQFALSDDINFDDYAHIFKSKKALDSCAKAWEHVTKVVGDDIPAVATPAEYPEGFFQ